MPSVAPSAGPSTTPTGSPSLKPSESPPSGPSGYPSVIPSNFLTEFPSAQPSTSPLAQGDTIAPLTSAVPSYLPFMMVVHNDSNNFTFGHGKNVMRSIIGQHCMAVVCLQL